MRDVPGRLLPVALALFQKKLSDAEIESLVETLAARGIAVVAGSKVSYSFEGDGG